ncbi:signal peptide peptidase SppA, 67K type [Shewanella halifaxensis HAW-EB4]|uniref:Signal peptide peptidase SppA, 67K type n=1 Tax=Shewanella halifaxensis (strain HAW-EB4) TaxID=458817 RepID=B0TT29_SHEHH|nr:signal peptide peptidase SppA [Shewanella halifaxensis]ABZ76590.1 signal peptide peptidase SppA, 67K type [Shewanella halifaxensis HAW-EB4]
MPTKPSIFKRMFLLIWNTVNGLRKLFLNLIFFGVIAIIIVSLTTDDGVEVEDGSALVLNLSGVIVDQKRQVDPIEAAMKSGNEADGSGEILLADVLTVIENAATDTRINQMVLDLGMLHGTGISKLQSIGNAIESFKATGKTVVANGNWYGQNQYFLASFADKVYLNPQGSVEIEGLARYRLYFKSALDKLKINAHVFRVGTFKSAVEPFIRDDMSDAAKEANLVLLNDLWQSYADTVAANRGIDSNNLSLSADNYLAELDKANGKSAEMALNMKWVDGLKTTDEFRLVMVDAVGKSADGDSYKHIDFYDYLSVTQTHPILSLNDKVGIIVAKGNILNGSQPAGQIGGKSTSELLRQARFDDSVKAVVLRVDSPGGSAFASEEIRQEVLAIKAANKPIIVSMGSYAASGGYWISASADYIYATPTTLTGSIGIFGMVTTFEDSLASIGVHTDGVGTSEWAGFSVTKGLSPQIQAIIQRHIERGYQDFISLVASERDMSLDYVDSIAQGRVWTGRKALELGLVDGLGELQDAVTKAAQMAKLEQYDTEVIERELSPQEQFIQEMLASASSYMPQSFAQSSVLETVLSQWSSVIDEFKSFDDPNGVYLYCDTCNY